MSVSKDVIKQCQINKQRKEDKEVIVNKPAENEQKEN